MLNPPMPVALIPARAGSGRIPGKNTMMVGGYPLIAYAIRSAIDAGIFSQVIVSSDSEETLGIAQRFGATPSLRLPIFSGEHVPDWPWVNYVLGMFDLCTNPKTPIFIIRPTSPFRTSTTILRAWSAYQSSTNVCMRGIEKCKQHPEKMWTDIKNISMGFVSPYAKVYLTTRWGQPMHSCPTQVLSRGVFIQNGCIDITTVGVIKDGVLTSNNPAPFFTEYPEGHDLNTKEDVWVMERLLQEGYEMQPINPGGWW